MEGSSTLYITTLQCLVTVVIVVVDIKHLVSHATFQDYMIKKSCNFMEGSSLLYVKSQPDLLTIDIVVVKLCFSFMAWSHALPGLVVIGIIVVETSWFYFVT